MKNALLISKINRIKKQQIRNLNFQSKSKLLVLFFVLIHCILPAQKDSSNKNILTIKYSNDFTVTGNGSCANWQNAEWNIIRQRSSKTLRNADWNIPPQQDSINDLQYKTYFKILYSGTGIYCLYKCEDSVITATLKEDYLNLYDEDVVEVFFWTDTTMPVYFEYELSPLNFELPILILNNKGKMMGWKPWQYEGVRKTIHAVNINEKNTKDKRLTWTAEFFIPYALLSPMENVPPVKGTQWRANFYRIDYDRNPVYSSWQLTRENFHDYERFGVIEFE